MSLYQDLMRGEAEAIILAKELRADYLLIDERKGKVEAERLGVTTLGLLGVLLLAKERGYILNIKDIIDELVHEASFWIDNKIIKRALEIAGE